MILYHDYFGIFYRELGSAPEKDDIVLPDSWKMDAKICESA